jgi:predicted amidohydrolase YtcJ
VHHASGHLATINTAMIERCEITEHTPTPGVALGPDGTPNGELQEPPAMLLAADAYRLLGQAMQSVEAKWSYAKEARNAGHTLVTDLGTTRLEQPEALQAWRDVTDDPGYPVRVMVAVSTMTGPSDPVELAALGAQLRDEGPDKLKFGIVKLLLDGSIQGFTARISWPHYHQPPEGHSGNGLWLIAPDQLADLVSSFHDAGLTVHCHCNGDEASEVFIDAVEKALERNPRWDHRHTVQHSQLTTPAQYERMAALGMQATIFSNHIYYWGDQHRDITVGPDRAAGMDACATAERAGVRFSIHSDCPITPMGHLHTVTIDAAHQIKLDHEIGTIETGKYADFAVLEADPYEVPPETLKDIGVWGTVLGGVPQQAGSGG